MSKKQISINMNDNLLREIEDVSKKLGLNRSATITMLLWNGIQMVFTPELLAAVKNIEINTPENENQ